MALYPAIAAASQAILGLIETAAIGGEFDGVEFSHYQAADFASPMGAGISLYLYRLTVSANRNLPPRLGPDGRRRRPPIPLDLHYLLTAWAEDAIRQQRLLGFAIRTLEDTTVLPAGVLNQHAPEPDLFGPAETVELVFEAISLQDESAVWYIAQNREAPSATYVARMVELESALDLEDEGAEVQTRELRFGELEPA